MGWGRAEAYGVALMWATELLRSSLTWSDEEEDGDDSRRPGGEGARPCKFQSNQLPEAAAFVLSRCFLC